MQTRSQTQSKKMLPVRQELEVNIDFDEASRAWKENKISIGNGSYKYVCCKRTITNKICSKKCLPGEDYCSIHFRSIKLNKNF